MMVPIISSPQVGILGVGSIVERPWAKQGWVCARRVVNLTLAGDHRASDGRSGARMLELMSKYLERPETL
jgi:pyruvate dehydrogenase E2 component (dihydrolipoamide acetyltransferase)